MKKVTYVFLMAIMVLTSCSSDNENHDENLINASLVGTWNGISSTYDKEEGGIPDYGIVKFTSDKRTEFIYEDFGNNGEDISEFGVWSLNGNILTITWNEADPGFKIYSLTISKLTETTLEWKTKNGVIETFQR